MCRRNNVMLRFRNVFECNARLCHARTTRLAVKRHPEPAVLPREDVNKTAPGESRAYSRPNKEFMVSLTKEKLYSRNRTICCSGSAGRLTITTHQPSLGLLCLFFAPEVRKQLLNAALTVLSDKYFMEIMASNERKHRCKTI